MADFGLSVTVNAYASWKDVVDTLRAGKNVYYTDASGSLMPKAVNVGEGVTIRGNNYSGSDRTTFLADFPDAIQVDGF